jgi:hypothetical protein
LSPLGEWEPVVAMALVPHRPAMARDVAAVTNVAARARA